MKKSTKIIILIVAVIAVIALGFFAVSNFSSSNDKEIQEIKGQELLNESTSPDGTYTIYSYLNNGGDTIQYSVLCSVKNNNTGEERNIYWNHDCANTNIQWVDNETAVINGTVVNVVNDHFDYREHQ